VQRWKDYIDDLPNLTRVRVPCWTGQSKESLSLEVHGYVDASSRAYAAIVYLRVIHSISNSQFSLICAKTKVAPEVSTMVVKTTSIPRLELNAVVLLNRLLSWIRCAVFRIERFDIRMDRLYDNISMFETTSLQMKHVCCQPSLRGADFVSRRDMAACSFEGKPRRLRRGLSASSHDLWWKGLPWLKGSSTTWPRRDPEMSDEQTAKVISTEAQKVIVHHADCTNEWKLPKRYSSWTRLVRVTAYVLRFIKNSQRGKNSQPRKRLPIEVSELREATHRWFRLVQKVHFSKKWSALSKNEPISNSSALKALKSMLGEDSLFCLGRRLQNTALEYGEISYYIAHRISELLIDCALLCIEILEINENRLSR